MPVDPVFGEVYVMKRTVFRPREEWADLPPGATGPEAADRIFQEINYLYPVTIVQSRYGGVYEGGFWLAFPCYPLQLEDEDWDASDNECAEWWDRAHEQNLLIGYGQTPNDALDDLMKSVLEREESEQTTITSRDGEVETHQPWSI